MHAPADALFSSLADPPRRAIFERLCRDGERPRVSSHEELK